MLGGVEKPLAPLRDDLVLQRGAPAITGEPRWLIYDPIRHRYFEITEQFFELLAVWGARTRAALKADAERSYGRSIDDEQIDELTQFLHANSLTDAPANGDSLAYLEQAEKAQRSLLMQGVHGYLFIRFPLFRPTRFLAATLPFVTFLYSRWMLWLTVTCGVLGVYLVSRQWESFASTFLYFLTFEGALLYGLSLVVVKTLHELAHAYTATRYGVRVPTMGVALLVMFPVLYTDVTDAWRLRSRRQQLAIAGAGIVMELAIACFATLAWALLPDGPAKSIAFLLATTGWILSLAVNLNPLMRFDGYYLLADLWGISNLQSRSFAIGRWWLRETLFDLKRTPPDRFSKRTRNLLVVYAYATWIYRFFLFLGIALLVYHYFFKALGVLLFVIEILYFIAFPIFREFEAWWHLRSEIMKTQRTLVTCCLAALLLVVFLVPWHSRVLVPAILEAEVDSRLFAPGAARIDAVLAKEGDHVKEGQLLFILDSPDLRHKLQVTERKIELGQRRLARASGGLRELGNQGVIEQELAAHQEAIEGYRREIERLAVRSPVAGIVRDLSTNIHPDRWVRHDELLARVVDTRKLRLRGVVSEDDIARIEEGATGRFVPDDPQRPSIDVRLTHIAPTGTQELKIDYLASTYNGPVAVEQGPDGRLVPTKGLHVARFEAQSPPPANVVRGMVQVKGRAESLAVAAWRQMMRVIVRESSV